MTKNLKAILSLCLVLALITAMALTMVSCDESTKYTDGTRGTLPTEATVPATDGTEAPETAPATDGTEPTEAPTPDKETFTLTVTFADGSEQTEDYALCEGTVGDFIFDRGIAYGEEGPYGLYVKTVLGESHSYEVDGSYWAFYIDGEYAMTGVSDTELEAGVTYQLKAEK